MNRFILQILIVISGNGLCRAQSVSEKKLPALYQELRKATSDTTKILALISIGTEHVVNSHSTIHEKAIDSAMFYAGKAETLSNKINYLRGKSSVLCLYSKIYKAYNDISKAEEYAFKAVNILKENGQTNTAALGEAYYVLAQAAIDLRPTSQTIAILEKARLIFKKHGYIKDEADAQLSIAYFSMAEGKLDPAITKLEEVLLLYKQAGVKDTRRTYSLLAMANNIIGRYDEAIDNGLKGIKVAEETKIEDPETAELYQYMGIIYDKINDKEKCLLYTAKALTILKRYNYEMATTQLESNIINILVRMKRQQEAFVYLKEMEKKINSTTPGVKEIIIVTCAQAYMVANDFKKAGVYIGLINEQLEKIPKGNPIRTRFYTTLTNYYYKQGLYDKARETANADLVLNERINNVEKLQTIHYMLFRLDSIASNYDASLDHLKKQQEYQEQLFNTKNNDKIARLQIEYDIEKKNKDIVLKEKDNKLLKQNARLQESRLSEANLTRNISFAGIVVLILAAGLIYRRYHINQRLKKEIHLKNTTLQSLLNEKEWLLKEIHHRVKNNLQVVISLLNTQAHFLSDDKAKAAIKNSQNRIYSMAIIHKKLYQSNNLSTINMEVYINEMIEYFKVSFDINQHISFETDIDAVELKTEQAVPIGLILNEAITNAIKHAFPNEREGIISISLKSLCENSLNLTIKDNGIGMPGNIEDKNSSLGIKLIKGFSNELNAGLSFIQDNGLGISLDFKNTNTAKKPSKISA